eukprot:760222-Hanusia_phi.AAC.2
MEVTTHERRENLYPMEVEELSVKLRREWLRFPKIAGGKEIVRSRLDEISNVFERDVLVFNVTLCDRDAGMSCARFTRLFLRYCFLGLMAQETRTFYVEMIAALFRSEGGKPVSMICQNISSDGEVGECVSMSGFQQTSTVVVTGISTGNESCANPEAAAKMLNDAKSRIQAGDPSSALQSLNRILQDDKLENDRQKKEAARIRNALLPPFTLSHRCCDSMNTYCTSIDKSLLFATDSGVEKDILKIVGSDQCSGLELLTEKFDARDTMIKDMLDLSHDGIQILFLNIAGVSQVEALKALNLTPSAGSHS